jgi:hypothetical protein
VFVRPGCKGFFLACFTIIYSSVGQLLVLEWLLGFGRGKRWVEILSVVKQDT